MTYQSNGYVPRVGYRQQFPLAGESLPARWDNHVAGFHLDDAANGSRVSVTGAYTMTDTNSNVGQGSQTKLGTASANPFDGSTDEILTVTTNDFRMSGDFTAIAWFYKTFDFQSGGDVLIAAIDGSGNPDWALVETASESSFFRIYDSSAGDEQTGPDMTSTDQWYFLSMSYNSTTRIMRTGHNGGSYQNSSALTNGLRQLSTQFVIQATVIANGGIVDEFHLFSEAKDDAWVTDMYNADSGRLYPE